jgi:hypothetical protein
MVIFHCYVSSPEGILFAAEAAGSCREDSAETFPSRMMIVVGLFFAVAHVFFRSPIEPYNISYTDSFFTYSKPYPNTTKEIYEQTRSYVSYVSTFFPSLMVCIDSWHKNSLALTHIGLSKLGIIITPNDKLRRESYCQNFCFFGVSFLSDALISILHWQLDNS